MTIKEAQEKIDGWIQQQGGGYFSELTNLGMLSEEVGEVAHWMIRKYGDQTLKPTEYEVDMDAAIEDEMNDVLWVLLCLANQMGIDMQAGIIKNMEKKTKRDADRHQRKT